MLYSSWLNEIKSGAQHTHYRHVANTAMGGIEKSGQHYSSSMQDDMNRHRDVNQGCGPPL